jgi:lysophospholipase L1-like esterase
MLQQLQELRFQLESGQAVCILGLGDSLTQGWMVREGFFDRFTRHCREHYASVDIRSVNLGVPGSTAGNAVHRLEAVSDYNPDLVIVQFGINDCYTGVPVERFSENLTTIVKAIVASGGQALLVSSCPVQDRYFNDRLDVFYTTIQEVGEALAQPVARLDQYWQSRVEQMTHKDEVASLWLDDGVHPSDAGHELMAQGLMAHWLAQAAPSSVSTADRSCN